LPDLSAHTSLSLLDLSSNPLLPSSTLSFLLGYLPPSLHSLILEYCPFQDISSASFTTPTSLVRLTLSGSLLGTHNLRALCNARCLAQVEYLAMRDCGINTFGFRMIATSKCLARLQILDIKGN
jgi:hypothetical protein